MSKFIFVATNISIHIFLFNKMCVQDGRQIALSHPLSASRKAECKTSNTEIVRNYFIKNGLMEYLNIFIFNGIEIFCLY